MQWDMIIGLDYAKDQLQNSMAEPMSSVLILGAEGSGKTALAMVSCCHAAVVDSSCQVAMV